VTRDGTIIDGCISDAAIAAAVTGRTIAAMVPVVAAADVVVIAAVVRRGREAGLDFQDFRRGTARTGT